MFSFKSIAIGDRDIFKKYSSITQFYNSEYSFTTMAAWQIPYQMKYAIIEDCVCVKSVHNSRENFYFPMGAKENIKKAIYALMAFCSEKAIPFTLAPVSDKMLELLSEYGMLELFTKEPRRNFADYIYKREKFVTLSGKKLHGKRNHFNYFINNYEHSFVPITHENEPACRDKLKALITERSLNPEEELNATMMALYYRDALELTGRCLFVGSELAGVILGERNNGIPIIQIAKSDIRYRGASVALFNFFLKENYHDCEYVNLMEDMGLEGLRSVKLSYDPDYLLEKSVLTLNASVV